MNAPGNPEKSADLIPIPEWLLTLIPELRLITKIHQLPQTMIDELEKARILMEKDREEILGMNADDLEASGLKPIINSPHFGPKTFARHYCKNFRVRITLRKDAVYVNKRTPNKKLRETFRDSVRNCAPHLAEQTWGGFYDDIDQVLRETNTDITRDLIILSLTGKEDERRILNETMNVQLVAAVIYLRLQGYALYPDLTL